MRASAVSVGLGGAPRSVPRAWCMIALEGNSHRSLAPRTPLLLQAVVHVPRVRGVHWAVLACDGDVSVQVY